MSDKDGFELLELLWNLFALGVIAFCALGVFGWIFGIGSPVTIISQGDAGVGYNYLTGEQKADVFTPGVTFIWPWTTVYKYPTTERTELSQDVFTTSDGAKVTVIQYVTFKLDQNALGKIHTTYKDQYFEKVVKPDWMDDTKKEIVSKPLSYFLSPNRDVGEVGSSVEKRLSTDLAKEGIIVKSVKIQDIPLPEGVSTAVNMRQELNASQDNPDLVSNYKHAEAIGKTGNKVIVTT